MTNDSIFKRNRLWFLNFFFLGRLTHNRHGELKIGMYSWGRRPPVHSWTFDYQEETRFTNEAKNAICDKKEKFKASCNIHYLCLSENIQKNHNLLRHLFFVPLAIYSHRFHIVGQVGCLTRFLWSIWKMWFYENMVLHIWIYGKHDKTLVFSLWPYGTWWHSLRIDWLYELLRLHSYYTSYTRTTAFYSTCLSILYWIIYRLYLFIWYWLHFKTFAILVFIFYKYQNII